MSETVAFVGLGNMGGPMAGNLVAAGFAVRGFDLSDDARAQAAARGVTLCDTVADAVHEADCVITMLPSGAHVITVWGQVRDAVRAGALVIDCSTIDVDSARAAHDLMAGCLTLDAPVSGGTGGAEAGTLTFMVGGDPAAFSRAAAVLAPMAGRVVHCGAAGAGQAAKICNNMILGISMIGVSEAFVLAENLGLSHQALFDVASTSSGQCWALNSYCPVPGPVPASPANRGYTPGFAAALMLKDLRLSQQAAQNSGAQTPLGASATEIYARYDELGHGAADFSGIIRHLRGE